MKLKARICRNKCKDPARRPQGRTTYQVRMLVKAKMVERPYERTVNDGIDYSKAWVLDYACPVCGMSFPITAADILRDTAKTKYPATTQDRQRERRLAEKLTYRRA